MHFSAAVILSALAAISLAAPAKILPRQANSTTITVPYSSGPACQGSSALVSNSWGVYMPDNTMGVETDANGLGGGLLDNLRGRCGDITGWTPSRDGAGTGLGATFSTTDFCTAFDITQAILAASGGTEDDCTFNGDLTVTLKGVFDALEVFGDLVKEIFGDIGLFLEGAAE